MTGPVPCGPDKKPLKIGWQKGGMPSEADVRRWWRESPDAMPGLRTGSASGIAVLDVDFKKGKNGFARLREMGLHPDEMSGTYVETPSGSRPSSKPSKQN